MLGEDSGAKGGARVENRTEGHGNRLRIQLTCATSSVADVNTFEALSPRISVRTRIDRTWMSHCVRLPKRDIRSAKPWVRLVLALCLGACRASAPINTGPLADAHSCYRMTGLGARRDSVNALPTVWLLLSDNSAKRFGAHAYEAMILEEGVVTPAAWHRVAREALALDWTERGAQRHADFMTTPDGIRSTATIVPGASSADRGISGQRVDCALPARHTATTGSSAR